MNKLIKYFSLAILVVYFSSCTNDPNSLGTDLVPNSDKLNFVVIDSYTSNFNQELTSYKYDSLRFGSSSTVLLGNYKNITSEVLIGFYINPADSIMDPYKADSSKLIKCWVEIQPTYWIGDSNSFQFSIHRINSSWNPSSISQDTINEIYNTLGPNLLDQSTYSFADTVMKFDLNTELVDGWIRRTYDSSYAPDYGILMRPISNSGIVGFQALTTYNDEDYPYLYMVFEQEGVFDTIIAIPSADLHVPKGEIYSNTNDNIILQSSLAVRGKLLFDLSLVPENIVINKATLDLFIDNNNTEFGTIDADTIAIGFLTDFEKSTLSTEIGKYPILKSGDKYSGDIRLFVQKWMDGEENKGLLIQLSDELRSVSRVGIFNSTSSVDSLKPRLTIYYTNKYE
ncbi:MAG: hypothetical protein IPH62_14200 [Ignavibacteriae bacterium]|nr:hypothetical protein [Ignavibacteriota bacterium]